MWRIHNADDRACWRMVGTRVSNCRWVVDNALVTGIVVCRRELCSIGGYSLTIEGKVDSFDPNWFGDICRNCKWMRHNTEEGYTVDED